MTRQGYRPDIDGLRAVAILLVVGHHINAPWMSGGFAGVDVFFVISGYLITGLLAREHMQHGRIGIAAFYARRARRLLPALGIVTAATLLLGVVTLLPDEQIALADSALASFAFAANFYFWMLGQSYFSDPGALLPLRHLWTLAVEEQFYVFWPLALIGLARLAARAKIDFVRLTAIALTTAGLLSLALSVAVTTRAPLAAFLLLPTRAWELGAGSLLALVPTLPGRWARPLGPLGLIAIAATTLLFGTSIPFPSYYALLPVLGAVALIAAGDGAPEGIVSRALASRPFVAVGTISYGWYLWHWPLLAFARNVSGTEPALARDAALAAMALVLAAVMWRWIERPARVGRFGVLRSTRGTLYGGAAIVLACAIAAVALSLWAGRPQPAGSILAQYRAARGGAVRDFPFCDNGTDSPRCAVGAPVGAPAVLLWGDSHAAHLTDGLDRAAREAGVRIVVRTMGGCVPGGFPDGVERRDPFWTACAQFNAAVLASVPSLQRDHGVQTVVIGGEWSDRWRGWDRQLAADVSSLRQAGLRIILARDLPMMPADFVTCAVRRGPDACAVLRDTVERGAAAIDDTLNRIAGATPDVQIWSPLDALCVDGRCRSVVDGRLLYRNRNHLTIDGSRSLAPSMTPLLRRLGGLTSIR